IGRHRRTPRKAPPEACGGLLAGAPLPARRLQHLLVLLLPHALAAFLDERSHGLREVSGPGTPGAHRARVAPDESAKVEDDPRVHLGAFHLADRLGAAAGVQLEGGRVERVHAVGDAPDVARAGERVLGAPAVDGVAGVLLALAQRFPAGRAVLARAARPAEPRDGDPVTLGEAGHTL